MQALEIQNVAAASSSDELSANAKATLFLANGSARSQENSLLVSQSSKLLVVNGEAKLLNPIRIDNAGSGILSNNGSGSNGMCLSPLAGLCYPITLATSPTLLKSS